MKSSNIQDIAVYRPLFVFDFEASLAKMSAFNFAPSAEKLS